MKVEELQVLITANADQFKGELIKIQQELRGLNTSATGMSKNMAGQFALMSTGLQVATNIVGKAVSAVTDTLFGMSKAIVENGSAYSRLKISTETVARNMGMTRQEVDKLRGSLAEANTYGTQAEEVIRTLAQSGLIEMSKQLKVTDARTGELASGVEGLVLVMKDLGASAGVDSADAIQALTKFIRRGEVTFAESMIQVGNMNKEYQAYANKLGIARQELSAQQEAEARMAIVYREGQKAFGAYANTMQTSGKAFNSVGNAVRNMSEIMGNILEPILRVVGNGFLQLVMAIRSSLIDSEGQLTQFAKSIQGWAIKVAGYLVAGFRIIGTLLSKLPIVGKYFEGLAKFSMKPIGAMKSIGSSAEEAGAGMDSASGSAKKLKKELAGLAGFDEMNVLTPPEDSSSGSGGGSVGAGGVGGLNPADWGMDLDTATEQINSFADEAQAKFKSVGDTIGTYIEPIRTAITIIGSFALAWKLVTTAMALWSGAGTVIPAIIAGITSPVGIAVIIIGTLIATFALLYQNFQSFRDVVSSVGQAISGVLNIALQALSDIWNNVWTNAINPALLWIQANIVPVFDAFMGKINEIVQIFIAELPKIQTALQPMIDAIGNVLVKAFELLGNIVKWVWDNVLKPLVDFVIANIVPAFQLIIPVITGVIKVFADVVTFILNLLMPVFDAIWKVVEFVFNAIKSVIEWAWNNVIKPVFQALWDFISGFIIPVFEFLWKVGEKVFNAIKDVVQKAWDGILKAIQPVIDWINKNIMPVINDLKDKFQVVWDGVKKGVEGVWEGIKGFFKNGINGVIDLINGFIDKINDGLKKFSDLATSVGASPITFRVGKIPKLAQGGIITSPTIAMIGEAGREAVMPLENNTGWISELADKINGRGNGQMQVVVNLGAEKIYDRFVDYINDKSMATNSTLLNI